MLPNTSLSGDDELSAEIPPQQLAAAASPNRPISDLLGNFADISALFEQLEHPLSVIELGKPLPKDKFMPGRRVGKCPAAHNKALLGEKRD